MGMRQFFHEYWWLVGGVVGGTIFAWMMYRRYRAGRLIPTAMASLVDNRKIVVALVVVGLLGMCYFISLDIFDDPRMADGELGWEETRWWEAGLGLITAASM